MDDVKNILDLIESYEWIECFGGRAPNQWDRIGEAVTAWNNNIRGMFSFKDEDNDWDESCYDYRPKDGTCGCNGFTWIQFSDPEGNQFAAERYLQTGMW